MKNEKEFAGLEMERKKEKREKPDSKVKEELFFGIIANMIYRKLPEDYWEKEGIGWK
ncbi:MAG: hypothetical protein IKG00_08255 [Lachnospiraceae bacterium]|nr:hypothetical protein [Lachnospiraceae bacterium]